MDEEWKGILKLNRISGVYRITNIFNNKSYIGSSIHISKRICRHFAELRKNYHHSSKLQRSYNKYGEGVFMAEIMEICKKENILDREQHYIDTLKPELNMLDNARGGIAKHTQESKLKMSISRKKFLNSLSDDRKKEISKNISVACKGRIITEEWRNNISIALKNSEKHINFLKSSYAERMEAVKNADYSLVSKEVIQYDKEGNFIRNFKSINDAIKATGKGAISKVCNGERKTANGFIWKFKNSNI